MKLAGLVDDREAVNEEKKSVQHVSLYRIGQEFVRQWYVVIEEVCSAEHMHRMGDTRLCSPCPPLSAACLLPLVQNRLSFATRTQHSVFPNSGQVWAVQICVFIIVTFPFREFFECTTKTER